MALSIPLNIVERLRRDVGEYNMVQLEEVLPLGVGRDGVDRRREEHRELLVAEEHGRAAQNQSDFGQSTQLIAVHT